MLIRQIAAQLGELQGRWLHVRVTTRPYPVHMWAESFDHNALGRLPDVAGALGWEGFLEGEQRHLMGLSMSDKEVFLGVEVSGRSRAGPLGRGRRPGAGPAGALGGRAPSSPRWSPRSRTSTRSCRGRGLDAVPATAEDMAWLMHRSCSLGPARAPHGVAGRRATAGRPRTSRRSPTASTLHQEPYAPTVQVVGRFGTQPVQRATSRCSRSG